MAPQVTTATTPRPRPHPHPPTETYLLWWELGAPPVEEVIVEVAVANPKLEVLKHAPVLRDVQGVKHVRTHLGRREVKGEGSEVT